MSITTVRSSPSNVWGGAEGSHGGAEAKSGKGTARSHSPLRGQPIRTERLYQLVVNAEEQERGRPLPDGAVTEAGVVTVRSNAVTAA